jgi:hypothetical protein
MTMFEKCWVIHTGKRFGSKIARASRNEGDRVGVGLVTEQVVEVDDPHGGHRQVC